jgi:hypothetical protein
MKYISTLLSNLRPVKMLASLLLTVVLVFASGCSAETKTGTSPTTVQLDKNIKGTLPMSSKSAATKGIVQLDKIEAKSKEALDNPATSLKTIEERSQGALNEVQGGAADRDKMYRTNERNPKLPVVKQAEKTLNKIKDS